MIAHVLLALPVDHGFDFLIPDDLAEKIEVGQRVNVRFTGRERTGIVTALTTESAHGDLEPVLGISSGPMYSASALTFVQEVARDYLAPPGLVVNRILPHRASTRPPKRSFCLAVDLTTALAALDRMTRAPRQTAVLRALIAAGEPMPQKKLRAEFGPITRTLARLVELGLVRECTLDQPPRKQDHPSHYGEQSAWVDRLPSAGTVLLYARHRVAGYVRLLLERVPPDGTALILAPEILLASTLHRFLSRYVPARIAIYHSGLPDGERGRIWEEVRTGQIRIVVGTRSSLFLPFPSLPILIVDTEQDRSYKQDEMLPYYHARDVAERRGKLIILASAAPAVETFYRTTTGDIPLLRVNDAPPARVHIVDMKDEPGILSTAVRDAISRARATEGKVLVMVPRRGYFQAVICKQCGRPLRCPRCGVNLVYDVKRAQLVCRVCGHAYPWFSCPHCGSRALRFVGAGVERVETEINSAFPDARTARIDGEVIRRHPDFDIKHALAHGADIIVGTPMIAKGPPIPGVQLAAVVGVDALLAIPDFRAAERTYQHLIGLADRMDDGELIIQTHYPDHYVLQSLATGKYELLLKNELVAREAFSYPPFSRLARILLTARSSAQQHADAARIDRILSQFDVKLLGPSPGRAGAELLLIKAKDMTTLRAACRAAKQAVSRVEVDINPDRI